jgi:hypothetical protein
MGAQILAIHPIGRSIPSIQMQENMTVYRHKDERYLRSERLKCRTPGCFVIKNSISEKISPKTSQDQSIVNHIIGFN